MKAKAVHAAGGGCGASTLKTACEELEALAMHTTALLFEIGKMAAGAMAHDLADDGLHPVVIQSFRELAGALSALAGEVEELGAAGGRLQPLLARAEALRQQGYGAAIEAATIDYARRDGEEIQKSVLPMIESSLRYTEQLRGARKRMDELTGKKGRA